MGFPLAKTIGAISGFSISVPLLFWMSFGQPRPKTLQLRLTTDQCHKYPFYINSTTYQPDTNFDPEADEIFFLYKASYLFQI